MSAVRIEAIRLASRDVEALIRFYKEAFGSREGDEPGSVRTLFLGNERIEFTSASASGDNPPLSNETGFQHFAIPVSDMAAALTHLQTLEGWTPVSTAGPEKLPEASGGVTAFKFRDPEGHPLEFLEFPAGKRPSVASASGLFLGIDHSAITVRDAEASIRFYQALGFRLEARQRNEGAEQGRLDGLSHSAVVDVVTLATADGCAPHLELLAYRDPPVAIASAGDGSPFATRLILSGVDGTEPFDTDPDWHRLLKV